MRIVIVSHKPCWPSARAPAGYATDGGFAFQMRALAELFDATAIAVPCAATGGDRPGEIPLGGRNLGIVPLTPPKGTGIRRKLRFPFWLLRNLGALVREIRRADAVHTPIPGDVGTIGMLLAVALRKPLFVRHCGNWFVQATTAERFWRWFVERFAHHPNVMLATGGAASPPSRRNANVRWIFSTSLTEDELAAYGRRRPAPPRDAPRLVIACRQDPEKGVGRVIAALPLVLHDFPGATLDVAGDGPALPEFRALAERLGVADRVTFHGKVDHERVLHLNRHADLFCYPTTASEGFPKVVLEALACGLPVVTTRVSVLPRLIGTGCGVLLDETTPEAVAAAVRHCLVEPERYRAMSAAALEAAGQFSLERWAEAIGDLLCAAWGPLRRDVAAGAERSLPAPARREAGRVA